MSAAKVAVVTGANQGIGKAIAASLVSNGLTVLVGSRNLKNGEEAAKSIGKGAHALQLDVTDAASVAVAAQRIKSEFGRLDVLVNNAAISRPGNSKASLEEVIEQQRASKANVKDVQEIWNTNVFSVLTVTQAMLPLLRESPAGRIVMVSSGVGSLTRMSDKSNAFRKMFGVGYSASKAAMNAITVSFAIELEETNIKVNACSPGYVGTNLNNYSGTRTIEQGAEEPVRLALLGPDGPTGGFFDQESKTLSW